METARVRPFILAICYQIARATDPDDIGKARYVPSLFGLAPDGVYHDGLPYGRPGALLPHPFSFSADSLR